jgi:hypothetical protein
MMVEEVGVGQPRGLRKRPSKGCKRGDGDSLEGVLSAPRGAPLGNDDAPRPSLVGQRELEVRIKLRPVLSSQLAEEA